MNPGSKTKLSNQFPYLLVGIIAFSWTCLAPSAAHAKDKIIHSMTHNGAADSDLFTVCESSGLVKMIGSKIQIQLKKLKNKHTTDGSKCTDDDIICVVRSDVHMSGSTNVLVANTILRGDAKRGNMKIKVDTCDVNAALCPVPALDVRTTGTTVICYKADPNFTTPIFTGGQLASACEGVVLGEFILPQNGVIAEKGMVGTCDD